MVLSLLPAVASANTLTSEETINLKVNEKCSVSTKIDNEETYTTVELIGTLPDGLNWGYGEVADPYINGTPTKEGTYTVTFKCNMYETSDIIEHKVTIVVGGPDIYTSEETINLKVNEKCSVSTKIDNEETSNIVRHTVTIKVTDSNAEVEKLENPFVDIAEESYYYDAILWAYYAEPQVTKGVDETHFGPNKTVTRGQTVTFLWRAMGEPEPKNSNNPFEDVKADDYYFKAVLWAVEKGITQGTDATHFSPYETCSTAHIVTFLYRTLNIGNDGWYEAAAKWAEDNGLLKDINKKVAPDENCPRADVVTFLYRTVGK